MELGTMAATGAWLWNEFGKDFLLWSKELIKRKYDDKKEQSKKLQALEHQWQNFNWGESAKRYKKHMQEIYGYIRVIGTTEPLPIGDIFTDVNILEKPQAYRRFDISELQKFQNDPEELENEKRTRGLKIVISRSGHRLYILGKPGAGKTTFLKYLVHQTIIASELNKLPIFVTLRDWNAQYTTLTDFIARQFAICNFPDAIPFIEYLFESGHTIILFDGLDEVPQEDGQRDKTIQSLHDFSKTFLKTQIVITCRVAASDYSFTEFTYVEMADFSPEQVKSYAYKWFYDSQETAEEFLKELNMEENKGIRDLGRSPLLLSMICLAYDETLSIPKRRVELYEEALDALLKKWDSSRRIKRDQIYMQLSLGYKRQMFARIATEYFDKGEIFFPKKHVARKIEQALSSFPPNNRIDSPDGESILEAISAQHGILVERAKGIYSFSHLTFQEYYTAKYIAENANQGTLASLAFHINDYRWREVFLLTASLLYEATPFFLIMQKTLQNILEDKPNLLVIQSWAKQRASRSSHRTSSKQRVLFWDLFFTLACDLDRSLIIDLNRDKDRETTRKLIRSLAQSFDFELNYDYKFDNALDHVREHGIDIALDYVLGNIQSFHTLAHDGLEKVSLDRITVNIILLANAFVLISQKQRSKEHVEKLQSILSLWQQLLVSLPNKKQPFNCPTHHSPDWEWRNFRDTIKKIAEDLLEVNLNTTLEADEYRVASAYIEANQLFWDCLKIANVENRKTVENMILKEPID